MESGLEDAEVTEPMRYMKCGETVFESTATEAIEFGFGVLVIRNIPCYKCSECGEILYTGDVAEKIEQIVERVRQLAQEIVVIDYAKAA